MDRRSLVAVFLLVPVIVAGCTAPGSPFDRSTPPINESALPPGVSSDGITSYGKLIDAHWSALDETGWGERLGTTYGWNGERNITETFRLRAEQGGYPLRYRLIQSHPPIEHGERVVETAWSNETITAARQSCADQRRVYIRDRRHPQEAPFDPAVGDSQFFLSGSLGNYRIGGIREFWPLSQGNYSITSAQWEQGTNRVLITLHAENQFAGWAGSFHSIYINDSMLIVATRGRVHFVNATYFARSRDCRKFSERFEYRLTRIGVKHVARPSWLQTAFSNISDNACAPIE